MTTRPVRSTTAFAVLSSMVAWTSAARATDPDDPTGARALFKEGRVLAAGGRYDEACPKFEASLKLDHGMGTEFNLADCWEHSGRKRDAAKLFTRVAEQAHEVGQSEREALARTRATNLDAAPDENAAAEPARPTSSQEPPPPAPMVIPLVVDSEGAARHATARAELQAEYEILAGLDAKMRSAESEARLLEQSGSGDAKLKTLLAEVSDLRSSIEAAWRQAAELVVLVGRRESSVSRPDKPAAPRRAALRGRGGRAN